MGKTLLGIIKLILCILIITYAESYFFDFLAWIGINTSSLSALIREILIVILYILILTGIYFVYKDDLSSDLRRFKRNWFPNILMSIVFFAVITIVIWVTSYLCEIVAESFGLGFTGIKHLNVFNQPVTLELIFLIIKSIIVIPFVKCAVYVLGVNELCNSKKAGILFSGLVPAVVTGFNMNGSLLYIFFNIIPVFVLFFGLAYIYRKNNNNIWYSITSIILYTLLASLLLAKIV